MKLMPPTPEQALKDLEALVPIAYEAMEIGTQFATHFFRSLAANDRRSGRPSNGRPDPDLHPALVRFFAKREFDRLKIDVAFERADQRNNGLLLEYEHVRRYHIRILKNADGELPPPGTSARKMRFYQQSFDFIRGGDPGSDWNLVILWYLNSRNWLDHLSLVCPKGGSEASAASYWQEPIPHPATGKQAGTDVSVPEEIDIRPKRLPGVVAGGEKK